MVNAILTMIKITLNVHVILDQNKEITGMVDVVIVMKYTLVSATVSAMTIQVNVYVTTVDYKLI